MTPIDPDRLTAPSIPVPPPVPGLATTPHPPQLTRVDGPPLGAAELAQLAAAHGRYKKIRRAIVVSSINAWTLTIFGGLTLLMGFNSVSGVLCGLALGAVAFFEFRGRAGLRRLESPAARLLGFNQMALGALLVGYALWNLHLTWSAPASTVLGITDPQLGYLLGSTEGLVRQVNEVLYGGVIAIGIGVQGMAALFYFRCEKSIQAYLSQTPDWISRLQQAGFSI